MEQNDQPADAPKKEEHVISDYYDEDKKRQMLELEGGIKKARNALFVTAALLLIGEIISMSRSGLEWTPLAIAIIVIEVGIFVALGFWTKTKPFTAIVIGLILFLGVIILSVTVSGQPIYSGIIMKIVIVVFLVSALKPAKAWEDLKKSS